MPYDDTNMTGKATTYGNGYTVARYVDNTDSLSRCNVGFVIRTWYEDSNHNYQFDSHEISCIQKITITDLDQPIIVSFPDDITVDCPDDIPSTTATYQGGICDQLAVSVTDVPFTVVNNACMKVERTFTVINWCDYQPADPDWDGSGIYTGTQTIKVVQRAAPRLQIRGDFEVGVDNDCVANDVTVSNVAVDYSDCPSDELKYEFYIDLDWDGEPESRYSHLLSGDRFIAPSPAGDTVTVTLADPLPIGEYKYKWSVTDGCGNFRSVSGTIRVIDNKPPTPYCILVQHATIGGSDMALPVRASSFNRGAFDNCTASEDIRLSFSQDLTDTLRTVDCSSRGVQFYRIYATDKAGNSDYCSVFLLAFDNGNCGPTFSALGSVSLPDGQAVPGIEVAVFDPDMEMQGSAYTDEEGLFNVSGLELHADRWLQVYDNNYHLPEEVTLGDFIKLHSRVLGLASFDDYYHEMAADVNQDGRISGADLQLMADHLMGGETWPTLGRLYTVPSDLMHEGAVTSEYYSFTDYDGSFDYGAYVIGDLDHSASSAIASLSVENRVLHGEVSHTGEGFDVTLPDDVEIKALLTTAPEGTQIDIADIEPIAQGSKNGRVYQIANYRGNQISYKGQVEPNAIQLQVLTAEGDVINVEVASPTQAGEVTAADDDLYCYPNPAYDVLHLTNDVNTVSILNTAGETVLSNAAQHAIDVSSFDAGLYFVRLTDTSGKTVVRRIVIAK